MKRFDSTVIEFQEEYNQFVSLWKRECVNITEKKVAQLSAATVHPLSEAAKKLLLSARELRSALEVLQRNDIIGEYRRR